MQTLTVAECNRLNLEANMEDLFTAKLGIAHQILDRGTSRAYHISPLNFIGQKHKFITPLLSLFEEYIERHPNLTLDGGGASGGRAFRG